MESGEALAKRVTPVGAGPGRKVYFIDRPGAPQSVILAGSLKDADGLSRA